jgi:hypothetical protein
MSAQMNPPALESFIRIVAEVIGLPLSQDRVTKLAIVLKDTLEEQALLAELDLSEVEPETTFEPRWD